MTAFLALNNIYIPGFYQELPLPHRTVGQLAPNMPVIGAAPDENQ